MCVWVYVRERERERERERDWLETLICVDQGFDISVQHFKILYGAVTLIQKTQLSETQSLSCIKRCSLLHCTLAQKYPNSKNATFFLPLNFVLQSIFKSVLPNAPNAAKACTIYVNL